MGLWPFEFDATSYWDPGVAVKATLKLPKTWYNLGADLQLGAGFRVGGGLLFKSDDPSITATLSGTSSVEIGGTDYEATQVSELVGTIDSKSRAPYALIGFGNQTSTGIGLFLDLGVAFLGDSPVTLAATKGDPTLINSDDFKDRLRLEQATIEDDLPTWARKYWPILNLGIKVGLGR